LVGLDKCGQATERGVKNMLILLIAVIMMAVLSIAADAVMEWRGWI
jgi:hypothetical protein